MTLTYFANEVYKSNETGPTKYKIGLFEEVALRIFFALLH